MLDFNTPKMKEYRLALSDNFNFFRMFLADDVDAIIQHFIDNGTMPLTDMSKIEAGLFSAVKKLAERYPGKVPQNDTDKLGIPKKLKYEKENLNYNIVHSLMHTLVHLQALTATILAFNKD